MGFLLGLIVGTALGAGLVIALAALRFSGVLDERDESDEAGA